MFCQDGEDGAEAEAGAEPEVTAASELAEGGDAQTSGETTIKHKAVNKLILETPLTT